MKQVQIKVSNIETAYAVSKLIPELNNPHEADEYYRRMNGRQSLVLIAYDGSKPVGFKVGYDKFQDGSFYSWMGGVLPDYRRNRVAKLLAEVQERWAIESGFDSIIFKTRNRHKAMLIFGLSNGFSIVDVEQREQIEENRIILKKMLK